MSAPEVTFAGPDRSPGLLRDVLSERVAAVPPGGSIDWVTYYFRDRRLAGELVDAHQRGVDVRVTLEGRPRTERANLRVIELLRSAIGPGLRVVTSPLDHWPRNKFWRARLHEKLYGFSHPRPHVLIGSFNPSGDDPELEPAVVAEIGDQDRGHNFLVELQDPGLVAGLLTHARGLHGGHHSVLSRVSPAANRVLSGDGLEIHFTPRLRAHPIFDLLDPLGAGSRVRIAASHLSGSQAQQALLGLARRGAAVEILAEDTERRVPRKLEAALVAAGIALRRVGDAGGLPMHNKFTLIDGTRDPSVIFGSFNWTRPSLRYNREITAIAGAGPLFTAFADRWEQLRSLAS